jgi:NAD(P)-dependent dehydrogenase (short-subunit alcohol dehydrogenase family)
MAVGRTPRRRLAAICSQLPPRVQLVAAAAAPGFGGGSINVAPKAIVLTGANRGLGLEFARQYADCEGVRLYACCRSPGAASELNEVAAGSGGAVTIHALDVTDQSSVDALAAALAGTTIDVLINNSGVNPDENKQRFSGDIDYEAWTATMEVNVYGVLRVTKALLPSLLLSEQKKLIHIGSRAGSVGSQQLESGRKGQIIYRSSKAALNMVAKLVDVELAEQGVISLIIHPVSQGTATWFATVLQLYNWRSFGT